eukprot:5976674-Amphidinium_carterae.1
MERAMFYCIWFRPGSKEGERVISRSLSSVRVLLGALRGWGFKIRIVHTVGCTLPKLALECLCCHPARRFEHGWDHVDAEPPFPAGAVFAEHLPAPTQSLQTCHCNAPCEKINSSSFLIPGRSRGRLASKKHLSRSHPYTSKAIRAEEAIQEGLERTEQLSLLRESSAKEQAE